MTVRSSPARPVLRLALVAALLASAVGLSGCRTVYSVDPTPRTLDEAVAVVGRGPVYLMLRDGRTRPVSDVRLTDSTVTYQVGTSVARYTRPRAEVLRLAVTKRAGETVAVAYWLHTLGQAFSWTSFSIWCRHRNCTYDTLANWGLSSVAASTAVNYAVNPVRRRVLFAAPR